MYVFVRIDICPSLSVIAAMEMKKPVGPANTHVTTIRTIELETISFSSYVTLCVLISVCIGLVVSIAFFVLDIIVLDTSFQWGGVSIADTWTSIIAMFVGPFVFGIVGLAGSLFTHRLFLWALRTYSGLSLTGTWSVTNRGDDLENATRQPKPRRPEEQ